MGWFILGILTYFLILLAEHALVAVSPHEAEQLRSDASGSAQRAFALTRQIRPVMAALLLARLLLKLLLVVFPAAWLVQSPVVRTALHDCSQGTDLSAEVVWFVAMALFAFALTGLFWMLKKIDNQRLIAGKAVFVLQRLGLFIFFWKKIFSPFVKKEKPAAKTKDGEPEKSRATQSVANAAATASEKREIELLKSIVKFGDVTVKQVMQPRSKVVAVDFCTGFHELLGVVRESGFSRLPVYQDDLDNVTGILYVKDLVLHLDKPADFEWQPLIRTNVLLAPESKRCTELLREFKLQKIHMAVVVDEYGGSAGIVTLEDILEEVTGEIRDEFDEESEVRYRKLDDRNYLFEGQALLNDVCRIAGLDAGTFDPVRGTADTLAGLALELKGDIPKTGAEVAWNGFLLTVVAADNRRVEQLKLTLPR
jgi:CBS domain containing-hemolysin-like protein